MKTLCALLLATSVLPAFGQSAPLGPADPPSPPDNKEAAKETPETKKAWTFGAEADVNSRYVWRGIESSAGAILQPSVWADHGNWELGAWGSLPLGGEPDRGRFNEVDYTLSYTHEGKGYTLKPQVLNYNYPGTGVSSTTEIDVKASVPWGPVSLYTEQSVDVGALDGAYFGELGVESEKELSPRWGRSAGVGIGWANAKFNRSYIGPSKAAFNVISGQIAWTYTAKNGVYVRPHLSASALLDRSLRTAADHPDFLVAGVAVGKEF